MCMQASSAHVQTTPRAERLWPLLFQGMPVGRTRRLVSTSKTRSCHLPTPVPSNAPSFQEAVSETTYSTGTAPKASKAWEGQLFVRGLDGKTQVLSSVRSDDTVGALRSRVRGYHPRAQRLVWAGKSLQDERSLASASAKRRL